MAQTQNQPFQPSIRQYVNALEAIFKRCSQVAHTEHLVHLHKRPGIRASVFAVLASTPLYLKRCVSAAANYLSLLEIDLCLLRCRRATVTSFETTTLIS
jgi:hypothetical protein